MVPPASLYHFKAQRLDLHQHNSPVNPATGEHLLVSHSGHCFISEWEELNLREPAPKAGGLPLTHTLFLG